MGTRTVETNFLTEEEAKADQAYPGVMGYSESYPRGIDRVKVIDPKTGQTVDGFKSTRFEYYG
jgi:hypothetical protein